MRAAIVHYWLLGMRGGEKVVEALCRLLPDADIFTLFYDPSRVSETIRSRRVTASFINPLRRFHRSLLPLMPFALENLDLRGYDLIVSSESGPAKGVIAPASARHVCYCHTPMRYLWEMYPEYSREFTRSRLKRTAMIPLTHWLRMWDYASAARVDEFVANSENVRRRIWKTYRRDSRVIHPPVAVECFYHRPASDYYLAVAELVSYKRLDTAVRIFTKSGRKLKIVGDGPEYKALKRIAGASIEFCGRAGDTELRDLFARSRAYILPGEEDFGIGTVEALASGKPVIALGRGGVLEIAPPEGAFLYDQMDDSGLEDALVRFEAAEENIPHRNLQAHAARFSESEFAARMREVLYRV